MMTGERDEDGAAIARRVGEILEGLSSRLEAAGVERSALASAYLAAAVSAARADEMGDAAIAAWLRDLAEVLDDARRH